MSCDEAAASVCFSIKKKKSLKVQKGKEILQNINAFPDTFIGTNTAQRSPLKKKSQSVGQEVPVCTAVWAFFLICGVAPLSPNNVS